jgi:hypothetical protein
MFDIPNFGLAGWVREVVTSFRPMLAWIVQWWRIEVAIFVVLVLSGGSGLKKTKGKTRG